MVAVIHFGSSPRNSLNYNEQKIQEDQATCLAAENYPEDVTSIL